MIFATSITVDHIVLCPAAAGHFFSSVDAVASNASSPSVARCVLVIVASSLSQLLQDSARRADRANALRPGRRSPAEQSAGANAAIGKVLPRPLLAPA